VLKLENIVIPASLCSKKLFETVLSVLSELFPTNIPPNVILLFKMLLPEPPISIELLLISQIVLFSIVFNPVEFGAYIALLKLEILPKFLIVTLL